VADHRLKAGLHEALLTAGLAAALDRLPAGELIAKPADLLDAESADRVSRHVAKLLARAIDSAPENQRAKAAIELARVVLKQLATMVNPRLDLAREMPVEPGSVLQALLRRRPDGSEETIERPLTPLLDTTLLTNAPGEPAVGHELRAEVASADAIDLVMAFVRWSGVRPLTSVLRRHCQDGKPLRVLTTIYTNSTEQRALD
jgi:hypothetical protein